MTKSFIKNLKDMGRAMVNNLDALYATPENIKFVESTTDSTGETKEQLALKKKYSWLELADLFIGSLIFRISFSST